MPAVRVTSKSPLHIVFVLDDSGSMSGKPIAELNEAMKFIVEAMTTMTMGQKSYFRISVIKYGCREEVVLENACESDIDVDSVFSLSASSGSTNAASALEAVERTLLKYPGKSTDFTPFVFFLSDGHPNEAQLALDVGDKLKKLSIEAGQPRVVTIGVGSDVDDSFMADLASTKELYKKLESPSKLTEFLPAIGTLVAQSGGAEQLEQEIMNL